MCFKVLGLKSALLDFVFNFHKEYNYILIAPNDKGSQIYCYSGLVNEIVWHLDSVKFTFFGITLPPEKWFLLLKVHNFTPVFGQIFEFILMVILNFSFKIVHFTNIVLCPGMPNSSPN